MIQLSQPTKIRLGGNHQKDVAQTLDGFLRLVYLSMQTLSLVIL